jgi:hypothetical protein
MSYDPIRKEIYITGGSYRKVNTSLPTNLQDLMCYNTQSNTLKEVFHDFTKHNGPDVNFSSTSFYEYNRKELYIFGGTYKSEKTETLSNNFWVFNFDTKKWNKAVKTTDSDYEAMLFGSRQPVTEDNVNDTLNTPCPRFAHTMCYSIKQGLGFIFGGNPNSKINKHPERLNDIWSFELKKPSIDDVRETICLKIYEFQFHELCVEGDIANAVKVLNENLFPIIKDLSQRKSLSQKLLNIDTESDSDKYTRRYNLYEDLIKYFTNPVDSDEFLNR